MIFFAPVAPIVANYNFVDGLTSNYDLKIVFDGYIPVFGGQEGTVNVDLGVSVLGKPKTVDSNLVTLLDLTELKVNFNGASMPVTLESARAYFPRSEVVISPLGKVVENKSNPASQPPIKLPGLDIKRFPELTVVPVEFPAGGVEQGTTWKYKKLFGDSNVEYTITVASISDKTINLDVKLHQRYRSIEDESHNQTTEPDQAYFEVTTVLDGDGKTTFDREKGLVTKSEIKAVAVSSSKELKAGTVTEKKLTTTMTSILRGSGAVAPAAEPKAPSAPAPAWRAKMERWGQKAVFYGKVALSQAERATFALIASLMGRLGF